MTNTIIRIVKHKFFYNSRNVQLIALILLSFLTQCEKEYSYESNLTSAKAKGTLKDSSGNCQSIIINGAYQVGSALNDSNCIKIVATITSIGTYTITTDTVNGYWFSDFGTIHDTGAHPFILKGHGKVVLPVISNFSVHFDSTYCTFSIAPNAAVFSFLAQPGNCPAIRVNGSYNTNIALNATDTVILPVNVTIPGTYAIQTKMINGMNFAAQGTFLNTGNYEVVLAGTGTPTADGVFSIPISVASSKCSFPVTVTNTMIMDTSMYWQFTVNGITYKGHLDSAFTKIEDFTGQPTVALAASGSIGFIYKPFLDSTFIIGVRKLGTVISTGIYNKDELQGIDYSGQINFSTTTKDIYFSSASLYPSNTYDPLPGFSIVLSVYDTATRLVQGSFSGYVYNSAKQPVNLSNGLFKTYLSH